MEPVVPLPACLGEVRWTNDEVAPVEWGKLTSIRRKVNHLLILQPFQHETSKSGNNGSLERHRTNLYGTDWGHA